MGNVGDDIADTLRVELNKTLICGEVDFSYFYGDENGGEQVRIELFLDGASQGSFDFTSDNGENFSNGEAGLYTADLDSKVMFDEVRLTALPFDGSGGDASDFLLEAIRGVAVQEVRIGGATQAEWLADISNTLGTTGILSATGPGDQVIVDDAKDRDNLMQVDLDGDGNAEKWGIGVGNLINRNESGTRTRYARESDGLNPDAGGNRSITSKPSEIGSYRTFDDPTTPENEGSDSLFVDLGDTALVGGGAVLSFFYSGENNDPEQLGYRLFKDDLLVADGIFTAKDSGKYQKNVNPGLGTYTFDVDPCVEWNKVEFFGIAQDDIKDAGDALLEEVFGYSVDCCCCCSDVPV